MAYIKKIENTAKGEISTIDQRVLLSKATIGREESVISIRKVWVYNWLI